jgi:hypothetical protein
MAPARFLADLLNISDEATIVALAWHVVTFVAVLAIAFGWRPKQRSACYSLVLPLLSVAAVSIALGSLFWGIAFLLLSIGLTVFARSAPIDRATAGPEWSMVAGLVMIAFAWVYPHFLTSESALTRLYAAPLGLVPSPTIALVIGFALLAGGFGARAWSAALGAAGVLFGLIGAIGFGVFSDLLLVAGALSLILTAVIHGRPVSAAIAPI